MWTALAGHLVSTISLLSHRVRNSLLSHHPQKRSMPQTSRMRHCTWRPFFALGYQTRQSAEMGEVCSPGHLRGENLTNSWWPFSVTQRTCCSQEKRWVGRGIFELYHYGCERFEAKLSHCFVLVLWGKCIFWRQAWIQVCRRRASLVRVSSPFFRPCSVLSKYPPPSASSTNRALMSDGKIRRYWWSWLEAEPCR